MIHLTPLVLTNIFLIFVSETVCVINTIHNTPIYDNILLYYKHNSVITVHNGIYIYLRMRLRIITSKLCHRQYRYTMIVKRADINLVRGVCL